MKQVIRFLGGVRLALGLLVGLGLFVMAGTVIEALTDSHAQAAQFTYRNPVFLVLLAGLFVNILVSALKRWPWKKGHIPFLVAHLGLLMVIGGTVAKAFFGLQGEMVLAQGTSTDAVHLPHTFGVYVEDREGSEIHSLEEMEVAAFYPHSEQRLTSWIEEGRTRVEGLPTLLEDGAMVTVEMPDGKDWLFRAATTPAPIPRSVTFCGEQVLVCNQQGTIQEAPGRCIMWDGGFGGYLWEADVAGIPIFSPIEQRITPAPSLKKLEENRPAITLVIDGEPISLRYDPVGRGLKWPTSDGERVLRFQPLVHSLPYKVSLQEGRQINYPGTDKPMAYECDLEVNGQPVTLSMNHVHQAKDGTRFYLSKLTPGMVQLTVNKDPAKRWLTYPGGILVAMGIGLLFLKRGLLLVLLLPTLTFAQTPVWHEGRIVPQEVYPEATGDPVPIELVSTGRLQAELIYKQIPWIWILIAGYLLTALTRRKSVGGVTFGLHTLMLALRCYILMRPPVSNMQETLLYVPWIGVLTALCFKQRWVLTGAGLAAAALLFLGRGDALETVQPVLNSQLWLTIHVLMVVGSYGVFLLCSVLGHIHLLRGGMRKPILRTMYIGTGLLVGGTILGGVWAAQSWGRFWDWDPKESWAFISSCAYLFFLHAYQFKIIKERGLAIGAITGFLFISFTWYGVNYLLGTGLHSYGFGAGGALYYGLFILAEALFLAFAQRRQTRTPM